MNYIYLSKIALYPKSGSERRVLDVYRYFKSKNKLCITGNTSEILSLLIKSSSKEYYLETTSIPFMFLNIRSPIKLFLLILVFIYKRFIRKNLFNIYIRDYHWKEKHFDLVFESQFRKRLYILFFLIEDYFYKLIATKIYVPTKEFGIRYGILDCEVLSPGINGVNPPKLNVKKKINIIYVGGLNSILYSLDESLNFFQENSDKFSLTIISRKSEFKYLNPKFSAFTLIDGSNVDIDMEINRSDLLLCYFDFNDYMSIALPVKICSALMNSTPIITNSSLVSINSFVNEYPYSGYSFTSITSILDLNLEDINNKKIGIYNSAMTDHSWDSRFRKLCL